MAEDMKAEVDAERRGDTIIIHYFTLPKNVPRRQGEGTRQYMEWESQLPKDVKYVRLLAVDAGAGLTTPFWESVGFDYIYSVPYDDDDTNIPNEMVKGVNGTPTPQPTPWRDDDDEIAEMRKRAGL